MKPLVVLILLTIGCSICYGQRYDTPRLELLDTEDIHDAFCIGDVVFITRESGAESATPKPHSLGGLPTVKSVVDKAKPSKTLMDFVDSLLGSHHGFEFASAKVLNIGDAGFQWNIVWTLHPDPGGMSGIPFEYHATILADGSVAPHEMVLCDHYEIVPLDAEKTIISWLPFEDLIKGKLPDEQRSIQLAQEALDAVLDRAAITLRFRPIRCEHQTVPYAFLNSSGDDSGCSFWAVHFVPKSVSSDNEKSHGTLIIWVCANGFTSDVELGQWSLGKRRTKE